MNRIALELPGGNQIPNLPIPAPKGLTPEQAGLFDNLGNFMSGLLNIIFYLALFLAFYWLVWGAWAYLFSGGEKENLAKARSRIRYAIIGLVVVLLAFLIALFAKDIFRPTKGWIPF